MKSESQQSLLNIPIFLWSVKSLILVPWAIITDVIVAAAHFKNDNLGWGGLTLTFLLPSLMFPFHYYHIIKFAVDHYKFLFKSSSPSKSEKDDIEDKEKMILELDAIKVHFEDIPQFIFQVYILWKTPIECWEADNLVAIQLESIVASALSISATVVPFYEKLGHKKHDNEKEAKKWNFMSVEGILTFIIGTFFIVFTKLILISWAFSVLEWSVWTFFIIFSMNCIYFAGLYLDDINFKRESLWKLLGRQFFYSLQLMFGYNNHTYGRGMNVFLFTMSLIPVAFALHAAVYTTDENNYFAKFAEYPFPSRTFCFTNSSINDQQDKWQDETRLFSNNCNVTYSGVLCDEEGGGQRWTIIIQLAIMITIPALYAFLTPLFALIFCVLGFIEYSKHKI